MLQEDEIITNVK